MGFSLGGLGEDWKSRRVPWVSHPSAGRQTVVFSDRSRTCALLLVLASISPQGRREKAIEDYKEERTRMLLYSGQRHLEYGLELRKRGLTTQAAAQIVMAVEASQGRNSGATFVLRLMRTYEDEFWKRKIEKPSRDKLEAYDKRAAKLRKEDHEAWLELVRWAQRADLDEQAYEELRELLLALDEPLDFDARGRLVVLDKTF